MFLKSRGGMHFTDVLLPSSESIEKFGPWQSATVIPLRRESPDRLAGILTSICRSAEAAHAPQLVVLVMNSSVDSFGRDRDRHQACLDLLAEAASKREGSHYFHLSPKAHLVVLDFSFDEGNRFAEASGVGLARKLGGDFSLLLFRKGLLLDPWLRTTDADAHVPINFFSPPPPKARAWIAPFRHLPEGEEIQHQSIAVYDIYLRHLRLGLAHARSPFAYHSIGSLIGVHLDVYATVAGFPDLKAGEDYYFLNKVRKQCAIHWGNSDPVELSGRNSDRVPFGTGKSIGKMLGNSKADWPFYNPRSFEVLREVLEKLLESEESLDKVPTDFQKFMAERRLKERFLKVASQCRTIEQWRRRAAELFDAFEQLKFLHFLRDQQFPMLSFAQALNESTFLPDELRQNSDDLSVLLGPMAALDEATPFV